jgi:hypothetical protein
MYRSILILFVLLSVSVSLSAQWLDYPTPGMPRTPDGKPNLSAPAPRTADGKPDLSGVWAVATGGSDGYALDPAIQQPGPNQFLDIAPDDKGQPYHRLPYKPGVAQLAQTRAAPPKTTEPHSLCLPDGFMVQHTWGNQFRKIVQTPGLLVILLEYNSMYRQIFLDERPLPVDPNPAWNGYSTGKWEGDTLVVQSAGYRDGQWLDTAGDPFTDAAKVTERFRRSDFGHLQIEITVDDPKAYTKPWTVTVNQVLAADTDLLEFICLENEKDIRHMNAAAEKAGGRVK